MIIVGHAHAVGEFAKVDKLIETLDRVGVDKVALCPGMKNNTSLWPLPNIPIRAVKHHPLYGRFFIHPGIRFSYNFVFRDRGDGNEFVHSFVQRYPDRVIQVYWPDPRKPDFIRKLGDDFERWRFKGIKLHQACTPFKNDGDEMKAVVEFARERGLPIFIHLWSDDEGRKLVELAKSQPDANFVILHLLALEVVVKCAGNAQNIYYDISPYSYIGESRIRYAIDAFGADHVVFGSDTPFDGDSLPRVIQRVRNMDLPDIHKEQILGGNVAALLKV
jgi:predicted TIM-barrel fold metal-dependent hydrolase